MLGETLPVPKETVKQRSLEYIKELSLETKADISTWNIDEVFGDKLFETPQELNKRFFAHFRRIEYEKRKTLSDENKKALESCRKKLFTPDKDRTLSRIEELKRKFDTWQAEMTAAGRELRNLQKVIDFPEDSAVDLVQATQEIVDQGFFELKSVNPRMLKDGRFLIEFITANDLILKHNHPDGRDFKTNFGKLIFGIRINGDVWARPSDEQVYSKCKSQSYFFPFIKPDGQICWGDGARSAQDLMKERKYADLFLLLKSVITTYPGGTPYKTVVEFFMNGKTPENKPIWDSLSVEELARYGLKPREQTEMPLSAILVDDDVCPHCQYNHFGEDYAEPYYCNDCGLNTEMAPNATQEFTCRNEECGEEFTRTTSTRECPRCEAQL